MRREPLKIGDQVTVASDAGDATGEVIGARIVKDRQLINLRTADGCRSMVLHLSDPNKPAVIVPPVSLPAARAIALAVLAGDDRRMPVTASANMLAAAVLTLAGGVA